ncbi:DUF1697 domain-containing protein [Paenibacillus sp. DMB20]|uniref:DUF1697 domain-containing protein n=1 Tax=Paenibacillus sp. DMB20 TaxID=1642570 RepID=UPI000627A9E4|nr:DUF1697 domain-containing protein [Paenibacillus sp. DMB20]KKO51058.1 hypothetical protein XI25_29075 [Paenibacillus sp. DMB20]
MVYAALLRGINVGGNNKIEMKRLKEVFEEAGMRSVVTYINTGNIIFTDDSRSKNEISNLLEEAIHAAFGLRIKVLVLSFDDFAKVMQALPESWTNDKQMKSDVLFLWDDIDDETVLEKLVIRPEVDTVKYVPGAILWSIDKADLAKSGMEKLAGNKISRQMTVRNVNTTRKIYEFMLAAQG